MVIKPQIEIDIDILREIKLLTCFNESELKNILELGETLRFDPYTNIVIEGELEWGLYIILEGSVGIFKANPNSGTVYDIGQLQVGEFFGEMSLIDDNARAATVRALTPSSLFRVSKEKFKGFVGEDPERKMRFFESCISQLVFRLREINDHYVVSQYQLWKSALKKERKVS